MNGDVAVELDALLLCPLAQGKTITISYSPCMGTVGVSTISIFELHTCTRGDAALAKSTPDEEGEFMLVGVLGELLFTTTCFFCCCFEKADAGVAAVGDGPRSSNMTLGAGIELKNAELEDDERP